MKLIQSKHFLLAFTALASPSLTACEWIVGMDEPLSPARDASLQMSSSAGGMTSGSSGGMGGGGGGPTGGGGATGSTTSTTSSSSSGTGGAGGGGTGGGAPACPDVHGCSLSTADNSFYLAMDYSITIEFNKTAYSPRCIVAPAGALISFEIISPATNFAADPLVGGSNGIPDPSNKIGTTNSGISVSVPTNTVSDCVLPYYDSAAPGKNGAIYLKP